MPASAEALPDLDLPLPLPDIVVAGLVVDGCSAAVGQQPGLLLVDPFFWVLLEVAEWELDEFWGWVNVGVNLCGNEQVNCAQMNLSC